MAESGGRKTYLKTLVLENSFDGSILAAGHHFGLKNHSERPIADDLALRVRDLLRFPCQAILDFFSNDLCVVHKSRTSQYKRLENTSRTMGIKTREAIPYHPCASSRTPRAYFVTSRTSGGDENGRQVGQRYREKGGLQFNSEWREET